MERDIETRLTVETKATILDEMRIIRAHLDCDEEENLRFRVSRPLTRVSKTSVTPSSGLGSDSGNSPTPSSSGGSSIEEAHALHMSRLESTLTRSIIKHSEPFSLRSLRRFSSSYHSAGLFDDCRHAFFNNDSEISVYQLGDLARKPASPGFSRVFTQQYKHGECIRNVASSKAYIIIFTNKRLLVFKINASIPIDTTSHGEWDPSGLACYESGTHLIIFLGQCQRTKTSKYKGQIIVCRYQIDSQTKKLPIFALNVPANDSPKRISFHGDSNILTCITRIRNKLLLWRLDDDLFSSSEPVEFLKNEYTAVSTESPIARADRA